MGIRRASNSSAATSRVGIGLGGLLVGSLTVVFSPAVVTPAAVAAPPASSVQEFQPTTPTRFGGRTIAVSINASNTNQVIVATESGGLFRSNDDGSNWFHVDSFPLHRMMDVKWSPNNPSLIVATAWTSGDSQNPGGVWRSTNAGASWQRATTPAACGTDHNGWGIDFEPSSNVVYAGSDCGLLTSIDGGATFTRTAIPGWTHAVVARAGGTVDVCSDDGHRRFTRAGGTLTLVNGPNAFPAVGPGASAGGCPQVNGGVAPAAHDLAGAPQDANVLFVMKGGTTTTACGGTVAAPRGVNFLFESDDAGVNWTQIGGGCGARAPWVQTYRSRDLDPTHFDIYYSGGLDTYRATCTSGVAGLRCTGLPAIGSPNVNRAHADPSTVGFTPDGTNCARFLVDDGGVERSTDCGANFTMAAGSGSGNGNFNGLQVYEVAGQIHPGHSDYVIGTQDNSIYNSTDSGATWPNVVCCEGWTFQMLRNAPTETGRMTFTACGPCSNRQTDIHLGGNSAWANAPGTALGADTGAPYLLPPQANTYVQWTSDGAGNFNLNLTTNAGGTWTPVAGATTNLPPMGHMFVSGPASDPTLYQPVCTNNCGFIAPSGGLIRISGVNTGGPATVTTIAGGVGRIGTHNYGNGSFRIQEASFGVDPNNPLHMIAADVAGNAMRETTDGGATWQNDAQLTSLVTENGRFSFSDPSGRLGAQAHAIYFDPTNGNRIFVGTESAGIMVSLDGGNSWTKMPGSEAVPAITSFFVDEVQNRIMVGSYGRGLWTLDVPEADLAVTKSHHPDPAVAGEQLFYDITVTNNGPDDASNVTVVDTLPNGVTYVTNTLAPPNSCSAVGQTVTCQLGSLPNGDSTSFTIKVAVNSDAIVGSGPRGITNTVSVSQLGAADPDASNNTATDTVVVDDRADLRVSKMCDPDTTVDAGQPIECTVFVDNLGPSAARGVVVDDTISSNGTFTVTNVSPAIAAGTPGCTLSNVTGGQKLTCRLGGLDAASTTTEGRAVVTYRISSNEGQDVDNLASVRSDTPDPNPNNNSAAVSLTIRSVADLRLATSTPASAIAGGPPVSWTLTATNDGVSTARNVRIQDAIPAGVHVVSVTGGSGCEAGVPGDPFQPAECSFGNIAAGASRTLTVTVTVDPATTGTLHHDGRVLSDTFDPNTNNNLVTASIAVTVNSDLSQAMEASPDPVTAGTILTYKATTTNLGPSTATDARVRIDLPAGVTYQGVTTSGGPALCGLLTSTVLSCSLGTMAPGGSTSVFVDVLVAPSVPHGATLTGTATASSGSNDANLANNVASDTAAVVRSADLAIVLTSEGVVYKPSTIIHYQWTVTNSGPSDAANVVVRQELPMPKTAIYNSNNYGCPAPTGTPPVLTCNLGTIPAGGSVTVQVNVLIRGNKGTITSTATVSSTTSDPTATNNTSIRKVTVK
jgi:uncharacterized repeat protein (TIGR01451 family)